MGKKYKFKDDDKKDGKYVKVKKECCEKYKKKGRCCKGCPQRDSCPIPGGPDKE